MVKSLSYICELSQNGIEGICKLGYLALGGSPGWALGTVGIGVHWFRRWLIGRTSSGGHAGKWSTDASEGGRPLQIESFCKVLAE